MASTTDTLTGAISGGGSPRSARSRAASPRHDAIAAHDNRLFRAGKKPYGRANVGIAAGGRLMLSRALAALGEIKPTVGSTIYCTPWDVLLFDAKHLTESARRP